MKSVFLTARLEIVQVSPATRNPQYLV